jgi:hypothetical protein
LITLLGSLARVSFLAKKLSICQKLFLVNIRTEEVDAKAGAEVFSLLVICDLLSRQFNALVFDEIPDCASAAVVETLAFGRTTIATAQAMAQTSLADIVLICSG